MTVSLTDRRLPESQTLRWFHALKPASWPKLVVPSLFGQLLGASAIGGLSLVALAWGFAFTGFGLAFIVLLNDWADREVDSIKRSMFPDGCSPKTIPDGILSARAIGFAGAACGVLCALLAAGADIALGREFAFEAGVGCMLVFVAYTLPPMRFNYRGGGELLETAGVGVALPLYNLYLQTGFLAPRAWPWVAGFAALSLGSAVASGLSDEQSDRVGGKRTFASTLGNRAARRLTEASVLLGAGIWAVATVSRPDLAPPWAAVPAIGIVAWNYAQMKRVSEEAVTNAFRAQGAYKHYLHRAIWHGTTVASVLLWVQSSFS